MKVFKWDYDKNVKIIEERGVSFEEIVVAINEGKALDVLTHPNQEKYPGQEIYVVEYKDYCYLVPCKQEEGICYLITVYPSRKMTKEYLRKEK
ncbi:MAG: BrnT family toxin [Candidatus Aminicenantes bacterium]|nr:BrnT family toxin [Candidatus Aminicenantes bacterium]NIM78588.1 BrnT family toxin [Candidatus Aminicenantes bacterium]NIN17835.1 BrnT family toxin [Candidatus Aminicenantes bacterium]NIN41739.1 BrnT family toxin [Candidatus Aminicenantes bacterium]NIN84488.1 BrnT family toxin [Candidatus Aminicenantes bacterium]